ncbi:spore coat protein U domain-containing protein [Brevundimonas sp. Root1279]|uniref:spore coat protein U domain-containing protein n=1 Tax=Brevundimonas sp. Root1279 TaxID=1736443 RepID=UPI000700AD8B|nr:spore coat U domain-containing protein [Brevundimonas sp. Root1279]KQW82300.1 hypothetical protein ASC65_08485 [Brevundimonas sp. Root1279]
MRTLIAAPLCVALAVAPRLALAQTTPEVSCAIRTTGLNFGVYSALEPAPATTVGRIDVVCIPPAVTATMKVSLSTGRSGQLQDRTMTFRDAPLHYNLYADPAHQRILGDGSSGSVAPFQSTRLIGRSSFRVYGIIWPRQAVPAGEYSDAVRIEVEF